MKYQVRVSRVYDSEAIEADNKTQAKEIYDKRKKRIKFFLIDEKLLDVTAVSHYEKPTCKIPEEYYKDVSREGWKLPKVADFISECLHENNVPFPKEFYRRYYQLEMEYSRRAEIISIEEFFDLADEYVNLEPKECKENYLKMKALFEDNKI